MAAATTVTGYDPTSLQVVTMETTSSNQAMPSENEYLADMVKLWERKQSQPGAGTRQKAAASGSSSRPSAEGARTAGSSSPKHQLKWRPRHTPRLSREDYIVVLKPRAPFELKSVLPCDRAGDAIRTYLGGPSSGTLHVWPVWDQNVLVCSVTSSSMVQRLLGDIQLLVADQQLPFRGHANGRKALSWRARRSRASSSTTVSWRTYAPTKRPSPPVLFAAPLGIDPRPARDPLPVAVPAVALKFKEYRKPAPPSTRKPSAPPSAGLQAASQAKPGSPPPATPPPATAVHYPPLVTASPQVSSQAGMTAPQPLLPSPPPPSPELSALRKQNALLQRQIAALTKQVAALQLQQQKPEGPPSAAALVEPAAPKLNSSATPNPCTTYPAPPTTAPAAPAAQGSPQNLSPIDQTLLLEDRISRLESAVLSHMSAINVEYIVAEVVQAAQAWALTQFRTKSTRSRSASTGSSSAPRRRKVAGSSSPDLNPASIPLPAPQGQGQGMEDDP
ncbi:hypothetical protein HPB50_012892 [Hyalomma asiaticum]|uniref:Uncharacterized protein n=1 Tax=Hyalomma asiaticum TaxID=266040 RepID=A0ACB7S181_HYAAI|nr:hypothetical protein HPB50_012892 [Hyalomma asiaticum]